MLQRARKVNPLITLQQVVKSVEGSEDDVGSTIWKSNGSFGVLYLIFATLTITGHLQAYSESQEGVHGVLQSVMPAVSYFRQVLLAKSDGQHLHRHTVHGSKENPWNWKVQNPEAVLI